MYWHASSVSQLTSAISIPFIIFNKTLCDQPSMVYVKQSPARDFPCTCAHVSKDGRRSLLGEQLVGGACESSGLQSQLDGQVDRGSGIQICAMADAPEDGVSLSDTPPSLGVQ